MTPRYFRRVSGVLAQFDQAARLDARDVVASGEWTSAASRGERLSLRHLPLGRADGDSPIMASRGGPMSRAGYLLDGLERLGLVMGEDDLLADVARHYRLRSRPRRSGRFP